jgi:copper chaperone CopZ
MKSNTRLTMAIEDLGCWGCGALIVERALVTTAGVARAYVSPATETAYVEYDAAQTGPAHLIAAIERAGFRASDLRLQVARPVEADDVPVRRAVELSRTERRR